jgi:hypothetical protein
VIAFKKVSRNKKIIFEKKKNLFKKIVCIEYFISREKFDFMNIEKV